MSPHDTSPCWCLIESDPGVFTELVTNLGVTGVQFEEIYSLDQNSFQNPISNFGDVFGFIFLFKWDSTVPSSSASQPQIVFPPGLFFAKQVIQNACATQAILSVLLNADNKINLGTELTKLKEFTSQFDPFMCGLTLSNSEKLREVHNSFKRNSTFEFTQEEESEEKDSFHFVSYVPFNGTLWELDGLQDGPIAVELYGNELTGTNELSHWTEIVRKELQRRIEVIQTQQTTTVDRQEIRFNVLAVVPDRLLKEQKELHKLRKEIIKTAALLISFGEDIALEENEDTEFFFDDMTDFEEAISVNSLKEKMNSLNSVISTKKEIIDLELMKREKWTKENQRRRHDYIPLILCCLKQTSLAFMYDAAVVFKGECPLPAVYGPVSLTMAQMYRCSSNTTVQSPFNARCGRTESPHNASPTASDLVLKLKEGKEPEKKDEIREVRFSGDTLDNEFLNKKKSKGLTRLPTVNTCLLTVCCIYHKPKAFGESSSEESDVNLDSEAPDRKKKKKGRKLHREDAPHCERVP